MIWYIFSKKESVMRLFCRTAVVFFWVMSANTQVFSQDTVRLNDSRFIFAQWDYENGYLYLPYVGESDCHFSFHTLCYDGSSYFDEIGYECRISKKESIKIYGIAFPIAGFNEFSFDTDTLCLKIKNFILGNGPGGTLDSVQITSQSEIKTMYLDEILCDWDTLGDYFILTDSIVRRALPLYCGYFEHPLLIEDTSFFVSARVSSGRDGICGLFVPYFFIYPVCTNYRYVCTTLHWNSISIVDWWPILAIVAPPSETPDPETDAICSVEKLGISTVSLYPNPATDAFSVKTDGSVSLVELYDAKGSLIRVWNGGQSRYGLYGIGAGVYAVKVTTTVGVAIKTLIIRE